MAFNYTSLAGLPPTDVVEDTFTLVMERPAEGAPEESEFFDLPIGMLRQFFTADLTERLTALETTPAPSVWPTSRVLAITGAASGSVMWDGTDDAELELTFAAGSLEVSHVAGLATVLLGLRQDVNAAGGHLSNLETRLDNLEAGSGAIWQFVVPDQTLLAGVPYMALSALDVFLPEDAPPLSQFQLHSVAGAVRIKSNGNVIRSVGVGNDLIVESGETVQLVASSLGQLEIV